MEKNMNKRIFFTFFTALSVSGFIVICSLGRSAKAQRQEAKITAYSEQVTEPEITVREYCGKIGVFKGNSQVPFEIIDYDIYLLSDFDRQQLKGGIIMRSEEELRRFIEDIST